MTKEKTYTYKYPQPDKTDITFPIKPVSDWVIIERIPVLDNTQLKAKKSNLVMMDGSIPKNIMELEKKKEAQSMTYEGAESEFLNQWSQHPFQGIVKALGNGRHLTEDTKIPLELNVGDHVMYRARTGEPIIADGKIYWMIKEHEIYGVYLNEVESPK